MSSSKDIPLGTVGKKFPRSELDLEPMQFEDLEASSLSNSPNFWSNFWKFVWLGVSVTAILILLGYGLIQFGSMNSGLVSSNATATSIPMTVWSTETSTFAQDSTTSMPERSTISSEATNMASTTLMAVKLNPSTPTILLATVTLSELAKTKKWCPWGMSNERCNRFHDQFTTTVEPPASQTFRAEYCTQQLGNQTYLEVNWLCRYCHRRAAVWNKAEWKSESFPSTCSANCFDNKHRRACAKRAYEWNQKTGEFGSPFTCKHC